MNTSETRDRLGVLLADPMAGLGLDLESVDLSVAGKRRVLRVAVDKDGGVTMDDIADATRAVSRVLDDSDAMGSRPYTLEVSSPGVDRPLTLPRHWRRNVGRLVKVTRSEGESVVGRIVDAGDSAARIDVDGTVEELPFAQVGKARIEIEFKARPVGRDDAGDDQLEA